MPQPLSDYFALEAGEFLDQLEALLRQPDAPDPVQFFRLARGVRGSAQIAGADPVAAVAERLEDGARALRDGVLEWSRELRERALRTVDDLRALVGAHGGWTEEHETRAQVAAERWGDAVEARRRGDAPASGDQIFAFVSREIAVVVGELDRVLAELEADPGAGEALRQVLRRMRPVRGVAGMEALAPVLEVLEGIEDTAHDVLSRAAPASPAQLALLRAGRDALRAVGGSVAQGSALAGSPELEAFRDRRDTAEAEQGEPEPGVVPVSRLFFDDAGPHVVASPAAPVAEQNGRTVPEEVESFLRIEATGFLDRAEGLISGQARPGRRFVRVARQLADLAASVRELAGTYGMDAVAAAADEAAARLQNAASADEARAALARLRATLPGGGPETREAEVADAVAATASAGAAEVDAAAEPDVVPVDLLLYDPDDALREALALRGRVAALAGVKEGSELAVLLDELFGLVETALAARASV